MNTISEKLKSLALDLTKTYPRSPHEKLAGYVIAARCVDKCRATLAQTNGEYHYDCPLDRMFLDFAAINAQELSEFIATGADDDGVSKWIEQHAQKRERVEIVKWNNEFRYKRLSEMPDQIQLRMEDYIPANVPAEVIPLICYLFNVFDAEEKRIRA